MIEPSSSFAASASGARPINESLMGQSVKSLWHRDRKKRKMSNKLTELSRLPLDIVELLGQANMCYFAGKNAEALPLLLEVLKKTAGRLPDCYDMLSMIFDDMGEIYMAYKMYLYKAMTLKASLASWEKIASLAYKLNYRSKFIMRKHLIYFIKNVPLYDYLYI